MKRLGLIILFGLLLGYSRLYNLENTTRFIWDESSDLVRVHQIYVDRKITLVGPISEDNSKVFGSLAYYLSMPFAILLKFDPLSPVFGTVLGGIITTGIILIIARKLNPRLNLIVLGLVLLGWFPLFQASRSGLWAWHVGYIPMWLALGILIALQKHKNYFLLSGLFLGLSVYHHYLAFFATFVFVCVRSLELILAKDIKKAILLVLGYILSFGPFVVFDLRHPPGLFLTKFMYNRPVEMQTTLDRTITKIGYLYSSTMDFFAQNKILALVLSITVFCLLLIDVKTKKRNFLWSLPWIGQLIGLVFINNDGVSIHYVLPGVVFFLVWLILSRQGLAKHLAKLCLIILATGSVLGMHIQLTRTNWQTDIPLVRNVALAMETIMKEKDLKNNNLAVLASPDNNVYGRRYRDVLLVNDIRLRTRDEYQYSDHLFVLSTADEATVRSDRAYEMHFFRAGDLVKTWTWNNSDWKLYLFNRNTR